MLKILVTANYKYIPSLDDILETSAVTRLRNQLLEAEHYQLAVEVRHIVVHLYYVILLQLLSRTLYQNALIQLQLQLPNCSMPYNAI